MIAGHHWAACAEGHAQALGDQLDLLAIGEAQGQHRRDRDPQSAVPQQPHGPGPAHAP